VIDWPKGPLGEVKVAAITTLPSAADELAKAVDAIQAAEGALSRAIGITADQLAQEVEGELATLRQTRNRLLVLRGGAKAEPPVPFDGTSWRA
jgi:hypothetical protein